MAGGSNSDFCVSQQLQLRFLTSHAFRDKNQRQRFDHPNENDLDGRSLAEHLETLSFNWVCVKAFGVLHPHIRFLEIFNMTKTGGLGLSFSIEAGRGPLSNSQFSWIKQSCPFAANQRMITNPIDRCGKIPAT